MMNWKYFGFITLVLLGFWGVQGSKTSFGLAESAGRLSTHQKIQNPGVKVTLSQQGLNYVAGVGLHFLTVLLQGLRIPDQSGKSDSKLFGTIAWSLNHFQFSNVVLSKSDIEVLEKKGVSLAIDQIAFDLSFDYSYSISNINVSDSGDATVKVGQTSIQLKLGINVTNGYPYFHAISDAMNIGTFDIQVNGDDLSKAILQLLAPFVHEILIEQLQKAIPDYIDNGLNKAFSTFHLQVGISPTVELDYSFIGDIEEENNYITLPMNGEFFLKKHHSECPFPRANLPSIVEKNKMLQIVISDFVPNSAGYVYYQLGQLSTNITQKMVPSWSPIGFNTSSFAYVIPELYKKYPNDAIMLGLEAVKPPVATFYSGGATISVYGYLTMYVEVSNEQFIPAFVLNGTITLSADVTLKNEVLYPQLSLFQIDFALYRSTIGTFDVSALNTLMNILFSKGMIPAVNLLLLEKGVPLPSIKGVSFVSPSIGFGDDLLYVATDIKINLPF